MLWALREHWQTWVLTGFQKPDFPRSKEKQDLHLTGKSNSSFRNTCSTILQKDFKIQNIQLQWRAGGTVTSDTAPCGLGRRVRRKCVCFTRMKSWVWTPRTQIKGQAWWQMPVTPSLSRWETEGNDLWKSVGHLDWHAEFQANKIPVTNKQESFLRSGT